MKNTLLNAIAIKILYNKNFFSLFIFIKWLNNRKNKCISQEKDNNKSIHSNIFIKFLCSCKNKHINKDDENNNSKNRIVIVFFTNSIKYLV